MPGDDAVRRTAGELQLRHGGRGDQAQATRLSLWHLLMQELDWGDQHLPSQLPERRRRGRRCHHHIQGTDMMSTISTTIADVEREEVLPWYSRYRYDAYYPSYQSKAEGEGVPPSYSRYRYDAYYPSYQSEGRGGGGATIIFKIWVWCLPSQLPERRWRGRWCLHHIQGTGMRSTIPATRACAQWKPSILQRPNFTHVDTCLFTAMPFA